MDWTGVIIPILLAVIAASPGVIALLRGRGKEKADIAATYTDIASDLLEEYRKKSEEIEEEYRTKFEEIEATVAEQAEKMRCQDRKIARQAGELAVQQLELDGQAVRITDLENERDEMMEGVSRLCTQIRNLGHEPVWEPE